MTVGVTVHPPEVLKEQWCVLTYQHGAHDGCEEAVCFETEEEANRYAQGWADDIPNDNYTEHEVVVFKAVRTFRGMRSWAHL